MTNDNYQKAILHLLMHQQSQIHAIRDMAIAIVSNRLGLDPEALIDRYNKKAKEGLEELKIQLQANYGMDDSDIDDLLAQILR